MNTPPRKATVCFLRRDNELLLALIEYGPDNRKWTGIGGFAEPGETPEDAVVREGLEETYIRFDAQKLRKVAELNGPNQLNIYFTEVWSGEIKTKEPSLKDLRWFPVDALPISEMHPGTDRWMPLVLQGKRVRITGDSVEEVDSFDQ